MEQIIEMLDLLVVEKAHESLGVSPEQLEKMFELLRDKAN